MKTNLHTPPTPAVVAARGFAARTRLCLALLGGLLLVADPSVHPLPLAAALGCVIIAGTGLLHLRGVSVGWLRIEEPVACLAGVLLVTLGPAELAPLTFLWVVTAAVGVLGRGGRAGPAGRVAVLAVLLSPSLVHGPSAETITLLLGAVALLLSVGRVSNETSELLRDPLTGCLSRAAIEAEAQRRLVARDAPPLALVLVDLDDFGLVNKRHGHQAGDELLRVAAHAMVTALRRDDVLGRLGGDEFLILADGAAAGIAGRALDALRRAGVPASAGAVRAPNDGDALEALLERADLRLRDAKARGKGQVGGAGASRPFAATTG